MEKYFPAQAKAKQDKEADEEDIIGNMRAKQQKIRISDEMLTLREPSDFVGNKLKDQVVRMKQIKFESLCPMFGHYYSCTNLVLKDYCAYYHVEDVRKAYFTQSDYAERG